jgi:hypothetical protein
LAPVAQAASCTATGLVRDAIDLTAAMINPPGTVTGDVDATGCNIGIYYSAGHGRVSQANVHGSNYYGIVNNGADVDILDSTVSDIGEKPFNGSQHGTAIHFVFGSAAKGDIKSNFVWNYQKGGIIVNGSGGHVTIQQNYVVGLGPRELHRPEWHPGWLWRGHVDPAEFRDRHSYTGANLASSGGILLVGGDCYGGIPTINTEIDQNVLLNNDVGVWLSNLDSSCNPVSTPTNNSIHNNAVINNAINNTTGNGPTQGYEAGISDSGNGDVIKNNDVCGLGYTPPGTATAALFVIDVTFTNSPVVKNNTTCSKPRRDHDDDFDHDRGGHGHRRHTTGSPIGGLPADKG